MLPFKVASVGHAIVGLAIGRAYGGETGRERGLAMAGFMGLAVLPDLDVLGVALGTSDYGPFGHRGFSHTLPFAVLGALAIALVAWQYNQRRAAAAGLLAFVALASHGVLDMLTFNTRGVLLLWPLSADRIFCDWRPIPPSPTGMEFLSARGLQAATVEMIYFAPLFLFGMWPWRGRRDPLTLVGAAWRGAAISATVIACLVFGHVVLRDTSVVSGLERGAAGRSLAVSP